MRKKAISSVKLKRMENVRAIPTNFARMVSFSVVHAARVAFLCVCSAFFGGSFVMLMHAQSATANGLNALSERAARLETAQGEIAMEIAEDHHDIAELRSQVATMNGIGIAIAAMAGVLQVVQMISNQRKAA